MQILSPSSLFALSGCKFNSLPLWHVDHAARCFG
jgi:hypothetical protein